MVLAGLPVRLLGRVHEIEPERAVDVEVDESRARGVPAAVDLPRAGGDGRVSLLREGLVTPADINIDRAKGLLLIPSFDADSVRAIPLAR